MPEVICNTSPLQYLHQIGQLELLPKLVSRITVPTAVAQELAKGRRRGLDLPIPEALAWIDLRAPASEQVVRLVADLGPRETGVLLLAMTLGILLDAKRRGLVPAVTPLVDDLQHLGFRLSEGTRSAVLRMVGEP